MLVVCFVCSDQLNQSGNISPFQITEIVFELKGQFTPKSKIPIFPVTVRVSYPSRLFWCDFQSYRPLSYLPSFEYNGTTWLSKRQKRMYLKNIMTLLLKTTDLVVNDFTQKLFSYRIVTRMYELSPGPLKQYCVVLELANVIFIILQLYNIDNKKERNMFFSYNWHKFVQA